MSDVSNRTASADGASGNRTRVHDPLRDEFVTVWTPVIRKVARGTFGFQDADADNIVQALCLLALQKRSTLPRDLAGMSRWVASAAWKLCWGEVRKDRGTSALTAEQVDGLAEDAPPDLLVTAEREARVGRAMSALPPRYQRVLRYMFFAPTPPSYADMADEFGIQISSIGALRKRALLRLEKELARAERQ